MFLCWHRVSSSAEEREAAGWMCCNQGSKEKLQTEGCFSKKWPPGPWCRDSQICAAVVLSRSRAASFLRFHLHYLLTDSPVVSVQFLCTSWAWMDTHLPNRWWMDIHFPNRWLQGRESCCRSHPQGPEAGNFIRNLPAIPAQLSVKWGVVRRRLRAETSVPADSVPPDKAGAAIGNENHGTRVREESWRSSAIDDNASKPLVWLRGSGTRLPRISPLLNL